MADTIYHNGSILTMAGKEPTYVEALAVKDGTIVFTGSKDQALAMKDDSTKVVDLAGKAMLPGFLDGHSHYINSLLVANQCKLYAPPSGPGKDVPSIIAELKKFAEERTAFFTTPYLTGGPGGEKDWKGEPTFPQDLANQMVKKVYDLKVPLILHCNGDATIDAFLTAYEFARAGDYSRPWNVTTIHTQFLRKDIKVVETIKGGVTIYPAPAGGEKALVKAPQEAGKTYTWRTHVCDMAGVNQAAHKEWTLTALNGEKIDVAKPPTMKFAHGKLSIFGGINRLSGSYALVDDGVVMGKLVSTKMAGPPALMELESNFAKTLATVDGFDVSGNELTLSSEGAVVATFRSGE